MKRILWLLAVAALLCGCTAQSPEATTSPLVQTGPQATEADGPAGIYLPGTDPEIRTGGAVRCYLPEEQDVYAMCLLNGAVLVFSGVESTTLTCYTGETLIPAGQIILDCRVAPEDSAFQISEHGITYYDPGDNALVYLDNELKEVSRLKLAEDLVGEPVLSADRTQIFYCTADAVRVYDTASGLDRLLKSISYAGQTLKGVFGQDAVLCCGLRDDQGRESAIFISSRDGRLLRELPSLPELVEQEGFYCLKLSDGLLETVLFGREGEEPRALYPLDPFARPWLLPMAAVTANASEGTTVLDYYDLDTGLRTASVEIPGVPELKNIHYNQEWDQVYLLACEENTGRPLILRWDCASTPTGDETDYIGRRYTAQNPDEAGLADCVARASAIGEQYGVTILVGPEAAAVEPADYILEYEHQVTLLRRELTVLEEALSCFPEGFFTGLPGETTICILRSITGNAQSGSVERARGIQFWEGERAFVALEAGEALRRTFFHELFHIIDSQVLSTTRVYYHWENLNPEGCRYFEDFTSYLTADVSRYLEGENRAFIDAYSMCYPREDRARIMEYACMEGNAHYFQSEIMQNKLKTLCQGIRKAFGLEKYEQPLLWEQYLTNL